MRNIHINQIGHFEQDHWIIKADTSRFGRNAIVYEGTYDGCIKYLNRMFQNPYIEKLTAKVNGYYCGEWFKNFVFTMHRNGFIEQDWSKLGL